MSITVVCVLFLIDHVDWNPWNWALCSLFFLHGDFTVFTSVLLLHLHGAALGSQRHVQSCTERLAKFSNSSLANWAPTDFSGMPYRLNSSFRALMVSWDVRSFNWSLQCIWSNNQLIAGDVPL